MLAVNSCAFSKPKAYKIVKQDGRLGLVMDRVSGKTLLEMLFTGEITPEKSGKKLGAIHREMLLTKTFGQLESNTDFYRSFVWRNKVISEDTRSRILGILEEFHEENTLCHGDFHLGNVLLDEQENATIIDFMNLAKGDANCDIMRTIYLTGMSYLPKNIPNYDTVLKMRETIISSYINALGGLYNEEKCRKWLPVILAARVSENCSEEENENATNLLKKTFKY